ncbi:MAG: hypothetical protein NTX25_20765 [Proteobacteria bacterium]|nr:hypothetical protein [Pseudomonadota bacterium]
MTELNRYTDTDQHTWRTFFQAIEAIWNQSPSLIHPWYLNNVDKLLSFRERIPSLAEINQILQPIAWRAEYVKGLAPAWDIARMLDQRIMPVSETIRSASQVFFANEPDFIHDIFGHLPSLFDPNYRRLLSLWSAAAARAPISEMDRASYHLNKQIVQAEGKVSSAALFHLHQAASELGQFARGMASPVLLFEKAYFWIFEFGLVKQAGQLQVLGAGLLSSLSELKKLATGKPVTRFLTLETLLAPYNISSYQEAYSHVSRWEDFEFLIQAMIQNSAAARIRQWEQRVHA